MSRFRGVPAHSADGYIDRLIQQGFTVAICEQVEDPAQASLPEAGYYPHDHPGYYHQRQCLSPKRVQLPRQRGIHPQWGGVRLR